MHKSVGGGEGGGGGGIREEPALFCCPLPQYLVFVFMCTKDITDLKNILQTPSFFKERKKKNHDRLT